jgi:hypothetical protein
MHKAGVLVVFAWSALGGSAWAEDEAPTAAAKGTLAPLGDETVLPQHAPEASRVGVGRNRKMDGGATFLLMPLGRGNGYYDLAFAYGVGVSLGYTVFRGLSVGVAPQVLFNIRHKDVDPQKQYDLMARIAYAFRVAAKIAICGEVLPGYSIISPPKGDSARGFVVAAGVGGAIDLVDRMFVNVGVGYQWGSQSLWIDGTQYFERTSFLRVALGGGMRF